MKESGFSLMCNLFNKGKFNIREWSSSLLTNKQKSATSDSQKYVLLSSKTGGKALFYCKSVVHVVAVVQFIGFEYAGVWLPLVVNQGTYTLKSMLSNFKTAQTAF